MINSEYTNEGPILYSQPNKLWKTGVYSITQKDFAKIHSNSEAFNQKAEAMQTHSLENNQNGACIDRCTEI